jgi:uncharacterized protein YkwD
MAPTDDRLKNAGRACSMEPLEGRRLLTASTPTALEQYMLELINRARANPVAEASRDGIDLNEGLAAGTISTAAKQPLAFNPDLITSARGHSQWMIDNQLFQHDGPGTTDPGTRMQGAGYDFSGAYGWGENIAEEGSTGSIDTTADTESEENNLFIDSSEPGRGHRVNIEDPTYQEVGVGIATGVFDGYNAELSTQDFAYSGTSAFLTGVAFNDSVKADNFYEPGEGLGGVTITARRSSDGAIFSTQTWTSGGYTLDLAPGMYQITAFEPGLSGTASGGSVTIGQQNVEVDFNSANAAVAAVPPTATLTAKNLDAVASTYEFEVTYAGSVTLNTRTFGLHNLTVTGPASFRASAKFVSARSSNGGKTQTVTYLLAAASRKWTAANDGTYHVYVRTNQVADVSGNFVAASLLGYFKIRVV